MEAVQEDANMSIINNNGMSFADATSMASENPAYKVMKIEDNEEENVYGVYAKDKRADDFDFGTIGQYSGELKEDTSMHPKRRNTHVGQYSQGMGDPDATEEDPATGKGGRRRRRRRRKSRGGKRRTKRRRKSRKSRGGKRRTKRRTKRRRR
jgi:hypothetical protein